MRIADLAKELKITENYINNKLKSLKFRSKEGGEITPVVEMIIRDALADEGIGHKVVDEPAPKKKAVKKAKSPAVSTKDKTKAKVIEAKKDKKPKAAPAKKKTALEEDDEVPVALNGPPSRINGCQSLCLYLSRNWCLMGTCAWGRQ